MKNALKIFLLIIFFSPAISQAQDWTPDKLDRRRALPNDNKPPEKLFPDYNLQPRPNEGIIRRVNIPSGERIVALTFDMCELATITTGCDMDTINFLRENKIPATLFMGGKWMRTHSRRVKQLMNEQELFEIANHNWSHGNCALLSDRRLSQEILWTQAQYELLRQEADPTLEHTPPVPALFRFPYGRSSEKALKMISSLGLRVIQWDVAAESGDNTKNKNAKRLAKKIANMTRPGSIILFHANLVPKGTANLLRFYVQELQDRGYTFMKVSDLLEMGTPETVREGYFTTPGDNLKLDGQFGFEGTGIKKRQ